MPLDTSIADLSFTNGLDNKKSPFRTNPPFLLQAENVVFEKTGSLSKRNGYETLSVTGLPLSDSPHTLVEHTNGELLCITPNDGIYRYSSVANRWIETNANTPPPIGVVSEPVVRQDRNSFFFDVGVVNEYKCIAWSIFDYDNLVDDAWVMITEADSGTVVVPPTQISGLGSETHVMPVDNDTFLVTGRTSTNNINAISIDTSTSTPTFSAVTLLVANVSEYDAHSIGTESTGNIVTVDSGSGATSVHQISTTPAVINTVVSAHVATLGQAIYHHVPSGLIVVIVSSNTTVSTWTTPDTYAGAASALSNLFTWDIQPAVTSGIMDVNFPAYITLTETNNANEVWLAGSAFEEDATPYGVHPAAQTRFVRFNVVTRTRTTTTRTRWHTFLASKAFNPDSRGPHVAVRPWYGPVFNSFSVGFITIPQPLHSEPTITLVTEYTTSTGVRDLQVVAKYGQDRIPDIPYPTGVPGGIPTFVPAVRNHIGSYAEVSTQIWEHVFEVRLEALGDTLGPIAVNNNPATLPVYGGNLAQINFSVEPIQHHNSSNLTVGSSGYTYSYDGQMVSEISASFTASPTANGAITATGPPSLSNGQHRYIIVYTYLDAAGNLHRSTPSALPLTLTIGGGGNQNEIIIPVPYLSSIDGEDGRLLQAEIYKSFDTNTIYRLHAQVSLEDVSPTHAGFLLYVDSVDYTTRSAALYTTGGVLEANSPPAFVDTTVANQRMWGISAEDRSTIWFSKPIIGGLAPEFNASFVIQLPEGGGTLSAIAELDDKVILFTEEEIYVVLGDGPNDTGGGNLFTSPRKIATDVGCINRASVVSGTFGVMFQSEKGIYLINRGLTVVYIGSGVEDEEQSGTLVPGIPRITSAVLVAFKNQVRFTLGTTTHRQLVYDYFHEQWTTFTSAGLGPALHSVLLGTNQVIASTSSIIRETQNTYLDISSVIPTFIRTGWIVSKIKGFFRITRSAFLGQHSTDDIRVSIFRNYLNTSPQVVTLTETELDTITAIGEFENLFSVHHRPQKMESVSFLIETGDFGGGVTSGAGTRFDGISSRIGIKKGLYKLPEEASR